MRETETAGDITWSGKREKQYPGFSLLLNLQSCSSTSCLQEAWETWLAGVSFLNEWARKGVSISLCCCSQVAQILWLKNNTNLFCYSSGVRYVKTKVSADLFLLEVSGGKRFLFQLLEAAWVSGSWTLPPFSKCIILTPDFIAISPFFGDFDPLDSILLLYWGHSIWENLPISRFLTKSVKSLLPCKAVYS